MPKARGKPAAKDIVARLERLEEERRVNEVLRKYQFSIDTGRLQDVLSLWTDDGVYELPMRGLRVEGKENLRKYYSRGLPSRSNVMHHHTNLAVSVKGNRARADGTWIGTYTVKGVHYFESGWYNPRTLRKESGQWKVEYMRLIHLFSCNIKDPTWHNILEPTGEGKENNDAYKYLDGIFDYSKI